MWNLSIMRILYVRGKGTDLSATPDIQKKVLDYYEGRLRTLLHPHFVKVAELDGSAKKSRWTPILDHLNLDKYDVIIGHSSGVHAVLRQAETRPLQNLILTSATDQHHNNKSELRTGWFDSPWDWKSICSNTRKIIVCNGGNDEYIPSIEGLNLSKKLNCEWHLVKEFTHSDWYYVDLVNGKNINLELLKLVEKIII